MIKWKAVKLIAQNQTSYMENLELEDFGGDDILRRIMALPQGEPISVQEAYQRTINEFNRLVETENVQKALWVIKNWIDWLSQEGFSIQLKGDEYEIVPDQQKKPKPQSPSPVKITMRVGEHFIQLITISTRPPIQGVKICPDNKAEILYATGETEMAFKAGENGYVVSDVVGEITTGTESKIKPFAWAA